MVWQEATRKHLLSEQIESLDRMSSDVTERWTSANDFARVDLAGGVLRTSIRPTLFRRTTESARLYERHPERVTLFRRTTESAPVYERSP